ncbi:hypothetical protein G6O69_06845 [Pseudenhygromyxa sp. WMMC2535]|uniref:hypothetical protein n=1 Tax=Pseudenhygromyxa sp. WMMC2535 TaxID=2712867 RepID=UPI0015565230|nr:hypothetical protein [Pseudenhygromyxa sp. WMMC2535]NVB37543.1 hypothetical protein [Pseudenhygromyxa sp. WMMC2535]
MTQAHRPLRRLPALACLTCLAGAAACAEEASVRFSWRVATDEAALADPDSVPPLQSVTQCAEVGLGTIEISAIAADGSVEKVSRFACFPSPFADGDSVEGPVLEPGEYTFELTALRRSGLEWTCDEEDEEAGACVGRASAGPTLVSVGLQPSVEFVLLAPPECDDGVDNDGDGRVDSKDRSCQSDPTGPEDGDIGTVSFQLSLTMLDSPVVLPRNVRANTVRIDIDGETVEQFTASDLELSSWPFRLPLFAERLDPGAHTLSVVLLGGAQQDSAELSESLSIDFEADDEQAGYVVERFDFSSDRFLEPIEDDFRVILSEIPYPGATESSATTCQLLDGEALDAMRLRVRDESEQVLDAASLGFDAVGGADVDDGWIELPCLVAPLSSSALIWGGYTLEAQGLLGGEVCFDSTYHGVLGPDELDYVGVVPLAPQGNDNAQNLYLQRVVDDEGYPPAGCVECSVDDDCLEGASNLRCEQGLCVPN